MRINFLYFVLIFFYCTENLFSQSGYFIKYKNEVTHSQIKSLISSGSLVTSAAVTLKKSVVPKITSIGVPESDILSRIYKVTFPSDLTDNEIKIITSSPEVEYFQKSVLYKVDFIPNDKLIHDQWALQKINAFAAWDITNGNDSVLVGVIDTGIDYLHPDLKNKIYINAAEDINSSGGFEPSDNNGIDDDQNGYIDDVIGWDFTDRAGFPFDSSGGDYLTWDNIPMDEYGHGTYIAGIISAESNNNEGVSGAAPGIRLVNLRAFDPAGYGEEDDVAAAIIYAVNNGIKVLNMSFGDNSFSFVLRDVLKYAYEKGIVLVGSSGNSSSDLPHYPSAFNEVISTGASTKEDYISSFSNFGSTVDLVAPGSEILTTALNNDYSSISGTSAAAPFVSATAALLLSKNNFSPAEIKQILKSTSDEINSSGWDLKSGAGRLNMERALRIAAPAEVRFNFPQQDYAVNQDSLEIIATILSPYFKKYELFFGTGLNPAEWESLTSGEFQFEQKKIYTLNIKGFRDSVYCLRIVISQTNGRTMEERVNFYINKAPAHIALHSLNPFYYGLYPTIAAEVITDKPTVVKMLYRARGKADFSFITLDGFATNNQFVKQQHYGLIPHNSVIAGTEYEIYFESVDLGGLKSQLMNGNSYYIVKTDPIPSQINESAAGFTLPKGQIFKDAVNFTGGNGDEVLIQDNLSSAYPTSLYKYTDNKLLRIDSMKLKYPKDFGDFNNDGKFDLLSALGRTGFLEQQTQSKSSQLVTMYLDSSNAFYPVLSDDIDNNGDYEILSIFNDKSLAIWDIDNSLNVTIKDTLKNFSQEDPLNEFSNSFGFTNAEITDANSDGVKELWVVDRDGDLISYLITPLGFVNGDTIHTDFNSDLSLITSGDYDGDNKEEIAVLLQSSENYSIAPFNLLIIFNTLNDKFNLIYEKYFLDPSEEFRSSFQSAGKSIRLVDVDLDNKSELILFTFPYAYIIKHYPLQNGGRVIFYKENINSNSIFTGDLNVNGVPEIAFPESDGIKFLEFVPSQKPAIPVSLTGFSIDSAKIQLQWFSSADKFYIFRGNSPAEVSLYDSSLTNHYLDSGIVNRTYFYQVQAVDMNFPYPHSNKTSTVNVFHHPPAKVRRVSAVGTNTILIEFTQKMSRTIENLTSFYIDVFEYPGSIAPGSEYSYLLTFNELPAGERRLFVSGLKDFYGSPVSRDSIDFIIDPNIIKLDFYIRSFSLLSPYKLEITFSESPEPVSAANILNYSFDPDNEITGIDLNQIDHSKIIITAKNIIGPVGKEYKLKISNLVSSDISGNLPLRNESGSVIVITSNASDLNDEFVYPNPVRLSKSSSVTFANITQYCEITIFDISGNKVRFLKENTLNGGIDWDLKDENSRFINSGIYIYRIVSVDEYGNQIQKKLG